jgi:hypothetical protein
MSTTTDPPTAPGIYRGLPDSVYRRIPAVSQSLLRAFIDAGCPRKFKRMPRKPVTDAMRYGLLLDAKWLTGDLSRFAIQPETYDVTGLKCPQCGSITESKQCRKCRCDRVETTVPAEWSNNAAKCREWRAEREAEGKEVITKDMVEQAEAAIARLNEDQEIREARENCDVQVAAIAEIDGVLCKALIDLLPKDGVRKALADLKAALTADPDEWPSYVFNGKLHVQSAFYLDVWNRASGEDLQEFWHFISETSEPYEPSIQPMSQEFIALGRDEYRRALRRYDECRTKGEWPGYESRATMPKKWMLRKYE